VGRLRKPHGLKGGVTVFPLTDDPEKVFAPGRELITLDLGGKKSGLRWWLNGATVSPGWLMKFRGRDSRDSLEGLRDIMLASRAEDLTPLGPDEVYSTTLRASRSPWKTDPAGTGLRPVRLARRADAGGAGTQTGIPAAVQEGVHSPVTGESPAGGRAIPETRDSHRVLEITAGGARMPMLLIKVVTLFPEVFEP
jgi:hypothetical protein